MLFQLGLITIDCPSGLNADHTSEKFGSDYAVKAVVGAQQPREFVGASDHHFTLSGTILPYFAARAGQGSGLPEIDVLRGMTGTGEPQLLVRGDGMNMGWFLITEVTKEDRFLSSEGIGREIIYTINMVESPNAASASSITGILTELFG